MFELFACEVSNKFKVFPHLLQVVADINKKRQQLMQVREKLSRYVPDNAQ